MLAIPSVISVTVHGAGKSDGRVWRSGRLDGIGDELDRVAAGPCRAKARRSRISQRSTSGSRTDPSRRRCFALRALLQPCVAQFLDRTLRQIDPDEVDLPHGLAGVLLLGGTNGLGRVHEPSPTVARADDEQYRHRASTGPVTLVVRLHAEHF